MACTWPVEERLAYMISSFYVASSAAKAGGIKENIMRAAREAGRTFCIVFFMLITPPKCENGIFCARLFGK